MPSAPSCVSRSSRSMWPSRSAQGSVSTPQARRRSSFSGAAAPVWARIVRMLPALRAMRLSGESDALLSGRMRTGFLKPSRRQSSIGSSARTVPAPTQMPLSWPRSWCTKRRASSEVTQRASPSAVAILPSRVIATLSATQGRRVVMYFRKMRFCSRISASSRPASTATPCARRISMPLPPTSGLGSVAPTTTRAMPAARMASVQGGCLPWWQQGSSVTYIVAPAGSSVQAASASRSACRSPYLW